MLTIIRILTKFQKQEQFWICGKFRKREHFLKFQNNFINMDKNFEVWKTWMFFELWTKFKTETLFEFVNKSWKNGDIF